MNTTQRKQAEGRVNRIHKQCEECLKFIEKQCKGKPDRKKPATTYFGTVIAIANKTGLNFCDRYEYDERLYVYPHKMETFTSIKNRQVKTLKKKINENETQEHIDLVDMATNLKLEDLAHLL